MQKDCWEVNGKREFDVLIVTLSQHFLSFFRFSFFSLSHSFTFLSLSYSRSLSLLLSFSPCRSFSLSIDFFSLLKLNRQSYQTKLPKHTKFVIYWLRNTYNQNSSFILYFADFLNDEKTVPSLPFALIISRFLSLLHFLLFFFYSCKSQNAYSPA